MQPPVDTEASPANASAVSRLIAALGHAQLCGAGGDEMRIVCRAHEIESVASAAQMQNDEHALRRPPGGRECKLAQRSAGEREKSAA